MLSCDTVFNCTVPLLNGLEMSQYAAYDVLSPFNGLERSPNSHYVQMVLKEIKF